jgi:hypothetical protein
MTWIILGLFVGVYLFFNKYFFTDSTNVDNYLDPMRFEKEPMMTKLPTFELLLQNTNHKNEAPQVLLRTSSLDLAAYLQANLQEAFLNMGYKSFSLYLKSEGATIIKRRQRSDAV